MYEELSPLVARSSSSTHSMVSDRHLLYGRSRHTLRRLVYRSKFYGNFQIPRNPRGTEHAQTVCTRLFSTHALEPGNEAKAYLELKWIYVCRLSAIHEQCHGQWSLFLL